MTNSEQESHWEIHRYLLDDPSFDRDTFEQRMLEDTDLALAVADEVERLELIQRTVVSSSTARDCATQVVTGRDTSTEHERGSTTRRRQVTVLLGTAIALLILLGSFQWFAPNGAGNRTNTALVHPVVEPGLEETAEFWLGMQDGDALIEELAIDSLAFDSSNTTIALETETEIDSTDETLDSSDSDWMLDIAIGYYGEMES